MLTQSTSFSPTCRLTSSPEVGPGATVGTPEQGYPPLLYQDVVSAWLYLSHAAIMPRPGPGHDSAQLRTATQGPQRRPASLHGRVRSRHVSKKVGCSRRSVVSLDPHGSVPNL
jgi:hypothetical protein